MLGVYQISTPQFYKSMFLKEFGMKLFMEYGCSYTPLGDVSFENMMTFKEFYDEFIKNKTK